MTETITRNGMNATELAESLGRKTDAIRKRWVSVFPERKFSASAELTEVEISALSVCKNSGVPRKNPSTEKQVSPSPAQQFDEKISDAAPGKNREPWFVMALPVLITALSICLTITGLYVFANWAGGILGGMFALFLFSAVLIARDRMKGITSEQALATVFRLECGAALLHCFTFWRLLPEFPEQFQPARVMICVALAGFAAYLSYSAVLTVRNYNAEVD